MDLSDYRTARSALRMLDPPAHRRTSRSPSTERRSGYGSDDASADLLRLTARMPKVSHPADAVSSWRRQDSAAVVEAPLQKDPCATLHTPVASSGVSSAEPTSPAGLRPQHESTPMAMTIRPEPRRNLVMNVSTALANGSITEDVVIASTEMSPSQRPMQPSQSVPYLPPAMRPRAQTSANPTLLDTPAAAAASTHASSNALSPKYLPPHQRNTLNINVNNASISHVASSASTPSSMISMPSPGLLAQQQYQQSTTHQLQNLLQGHRFFRPPLSPQPHQLSNAMMASSQSVGAHGNGRVRADTIASAAPIARAPLTVNWWETPVTPSTFSNFPSPVPPLTAAQVQAQREAQQQQLALNAKLERSLTLPDSPRITVSKPVKNGVKHRESLDAIAPLEERDLGVKRVSDSAPSNKRPVSMHLAPRENPIDAGPLSAPLGTIPIAVAANPVPKKPSPPNLEFKAKSSLKEKYALRIPPRKRNRQLRDFELIDTLGTGTFGRVYLCRERFGPQDEYFALKVLRKVDVVRLKQVEHINSEKDILVGVRHPFIVNLHCAFQDDLNLYMLMEYIIGALEYLHGMDIVYRDLKPENLLLDKNGHIKITDFGFAKRIEDRTWTLCGTPEYLAPEIIQSKGHGKAVDWWALGILTFEMLAGYPPFFDDNPFGIYEKILSGRIQFPAHFNLHAKDLVRRFLTADRSQRLGNMKGGAADVKDHKWFKGVDWDGLLDRSVRAPIQPRVSGPSDVGNFESSPPLLSRCADEMCRISSRARTYRRYQPR